MYQKPKFVNNDEYLSCDFSVHVHFEEAVTEKEAAENIERFIQTDGLLPKWVHMGFPRIKSGDVLKETLVKSCGEARWVSLGPEHGDHIHCACSNCGHTEEAIRAVHIGRSSDDYTGVVYNFCPKCGSHMSI